MKKALLFLPAIALLSACGGSISVQEAQQITTELEVSVNVQAMDLDGDGMLSAEEARPLLGLWNTLTPAQQQTLATRLGTSVPSAPSTPSTPSTPSAPS